MGGGLVRCTGGDDGEIEVEVEADHETYFFCKLNVRCTFLPS